MNNFNPIHTRNYPAMKLPVNNLRPRQKYENRKYSKLSYLLIFMLFSQWKMKKKTKKKE